MESWRKAENFYLHMTEKRQKLFFWVIWRLNCFFMTPSLNLTSSCNLLSSSSEVSPCGPEGLHSQKGCVCSGLNKGSSVKQDVASRSFSASLSLFPAGPACPLSAPLLPSAWGWVCLVGQEGRQRLQEGGVTLVGAGRISEKKGRREGGITSVQGGALIQWPCSGAGAGSNIWRALLLLQDSWWAPAPPGRAAGWALTGQWWSGGGSLPDPERKQLDHKKGGGGQTLWFTSWTIKVLFEKKSSVGCTE